VRINAKSAAGALATLDVVSNAMINASVDTYRLISVKASYAWVDIQVVADDGMTFGLAHSDYTAAEVEECLEAIAAIDRGDKIAQEQSNRLVREIGSIESLDSTGTGSRVFADGRQVHTRLNWFMSIGDQLNLWIRNASGIVWTTGSSISMNGVIWIKDSV